MEKLSSDVRVWRGLGVVHRGFLLISRNFSLFCGNLSRKLQYSRDKGWFRLQQPNAGRKSFKNARKSAFFEEEKKEEKKNLHISSSYAKILGETKFQLLEFPQCGSKDVKEERKKKE